VVPYCNAQLSAFQRSLDSLADLDISVVALSVDNEASHRIQNRSIRQWLQRRPRPANSTSHYPSFVKPFFSQILLEGPFVTAGKAWTCPNFRSPRAFSRTSRTAWLAIPRFWNSGRIIHPIS